LSVENRKKKEISDDQKKFEKIQKKITTQKKDNEVKQTFTSHIRQ
jgi:hypothetical protein